MAKSMRARMGGDKRSKAGREQAQRLAIFGFLFKVIWWIPKTLFHIITFGKFRKKNK